jgi:hypothetical protein
MYEMYVCMYVCMYVLCFAHLYGSIGGLLIIVFYLLASAMLMHAHAHGDYILPCQLPPLKEGSDYMHQPTNLIS